MSTPPCRLYLTTPRQFDISDFAATLETLLSQTDCGCVLFGANSDDAGWMEDAASELMAICFAHDTAFLITDNPDIALKLGVDGVHMSGGFEAYNAAREQLGAERIVGAGGISSRHDAMLAGEAGADYVSFGNMQGADNHKRTCEFVEWWSDLFEIPCLAFYDGKLEQAEQLIVAGVDFICPGEKFWTSANDPVQMIKHLAQTIKTKAAA